MQPGKKHFTNAQRGVSLSGLIFVLAAVGVLAVFALKIVPSFIEYRAIKGAIVRARDAGGSAREMQLSFDKNADVNYVTTITGRDLAFSRDNGTTEISFAYEKRIPLAGNVSLVIDYSGTTDPSGEVAAKTETAAK